jgi:citronellol/citronellal dehydrogenase
MPYQSGFRPGLFDGQTVFIPGGGGGLGRCIAHELSFLGARLVIAGRSMEKLEKIQQEISEDGGEVAGIYSAELRDETAVTDLVSEVLSKHGRIQGLVNAAGGQFPSRLEDLSLNGWKSVIDNNLTSYFLTSREMYRQCFKEHGGNIVHLGADYHRGMPGMGHNGAARAGLANITMTSAVEWAGSGVRVNSVVPGFIATTGLDRYPEDAWDSLKSVVKKAPISRHGSAAEISAAVVFLMSEMASYITGTEVIVDGGMQLGKDSFVFSADRQVVPEPFNGFHRDERARLLEER